jgi:Nif-specific regulatory protein
MPAPANRARNALDGMYEISRVLTSPMRIEAALSAVTHSLVTYLDLHHSMVVLLNDQGTVDWMAGHNQDDSSAHIYLEQIAQPIISRIIATRMPVFLPDVASDPLFADIPMAPVGQRCVFFGVPILERDRVIGAITAELFAPDDGSAPTYDDEMNFLVMVANLISQTARLQNLVARDRERLMEEGRLAQKSLQHTMARPSPGVAGIVGESPAIREIMRKIHIVARSHLPVLLRGESGTGKELFAQAIHDLSLRRSGPMVKVNCAALPDSMLESELFGHEKGAFTGAIAQRKGRFELADGGTLFLDEIGEISASFQAKLLRALQQGEFERVGGSTTVKVDVRVVAATNRNLEEAVRKNEFRADLYFRICVVPIVLTPLRDRAEDIPLLAHTFLGRFNSQHGTSLSFSDSAMEVLSHCPFPGNIRELESCVNRTAAFAHGSCIHSDDFACHNDSCLSSMLWRDRKGESARLPIAPVSPLPITRMPPPPAPHAPEPEADDGDSSDMLESMGGLVVEKHRLVEAMERAGWVQAKAARLLGLTTRQIGYALRKHNVEVKKF